MTLTAGFGGEADTALRYFRSDVPAKGLRRHGWDVTVEQHVANEHRGPFQPWDGNGPPRPAPSVMVLRATNDQSLVGDQYDGPPASLVADIAHARDTGQVVVLDVDDDLWNIPDWSEVTRNKQGTYPAIDLVMLDKLVGTVDAVTVSTPRIADVVSGLDRGARVELVRNGVDLLDFHPHEPTEGRALRVGWMGGARFHGPHLRTMIPALDVLPRYGAEFIHLGWVEESWVESDDLAGEVRDAAPGVTVGWIDWLPYSLLRQALAHIDIGLIPRVPSEFNEGQSTSSGMAYAAAGIPFLCAPSAEYRRFADEGAGIVCDTLDDWRAGLELLLSNQRARESAAARGYRAVCNHSVAQVGDDWHRVLSDLMP